MKKILQLSIFSLLMITQLSVMAQDRTVAGKVTSADDGSTMPGVNVVLKGTTIGVVTDANGDYRISIPSSGGTLVFSFIGMTTTEVEVGSRAVVDIQLGTDVTQLSEVIVTGYGTTLKKEFSGVSVSS